MNGVRRAPAPSGESRRGRFIVLEGIDGAGKSEQAGRLVEWLEASGWRVVSTREPTEGAWGRRYRAWARGEFEAEPAEVLHFFTEDRREHVAQLVTPALGAGKLVVCDRYIGSTLAYQAAQGVARRQLDAATRDTAFPEPDLALWLRLPIMQALRRLASRSGERFERRAFLERVDAEYAKLGLEELDASGSIDAVAARIRSRVASLLSAED